MHIADVEGGNLGANGVVAGGIPMAVGVGIGLKLQKRSQIIMCFFGDGAANEGAFHESLNMAAIYRLPVVFICENNQYGMSLPIQKAIAIEKISDRAAAYGMPGLTVDGNDVLAVHQAACQAVDLARRGGGPTVLENVNYSWRGHSKSDANRYRTKEEIELWKAKDPIPRLSNALDQAGLLSENEVSSVREEAYREVEEAVAFADACSEPELSSIEDGVYA
jgi:TPP-dependent pyruvate/acetoin dehydrogenase alpha subunit